MPVLPSGSVQPVELRTRSGVNSRPNVHADKAFCDLLEARFPGNRGVPFEKLERVPGLVFVQRVLVDGVEQEHSKLGYTLVSYSPDMLKQDQLYRVNDMLVAIFFAEDIQRSDGITHTIELVDDVIYVLSTT